MNNPFKRKKTATPRKKFVLDTYAKVGVGLRLRGFSLRDSINDMANFSGVTIESEVHFRGIFSQFVRVKVKGDRYQIERFVYYMNGLSTIGVKVGALVPLEV